MSSSFNFTSDYPYSHPPSSDYPASSQSPHIARRSLTMQPSRLREVITAGDLVEDNDDAVLSHDSHSPPTTSRSSSSSDHATRPSKAYRLIDHSPPSSSAHGTT